MIIWNTDHTPKIGDMGQIMEWDAAVVTVHEQDETVTILIFDEAQGDRMVEIPYRILWG